MKRPAFFRSALALLLCFAMVLSFVPMQVAAETQEPAAVANDCEKDGHNYKTAKIEATCQQYPCTRYTCSSCGDSYDVYPDELYSDWQETKPNVDESLIQSKTQYRTSEYETVTSFNTALDGYEQIGSQWSKVDTRTVTYVSSWPAGFDKTNSLYTQYDKIAMKVTASESSNRKTEINSDAIVGYLYYHWCYEGYPYTVDTKTDTYNRFHAYYSTKSPSEADSYDISDNSFRFDDSTACADSVWYFYVPVYEQTYTNYRLEYTYGTWGNFSEWSDTEATGTDTLKVATRTVHRYLNADMTQHSYNSVTTPASCTAAGQVVYTCADCDHSYTETLPQTGHSYENGKCTVCGGSEPNYYLIGYINGADYGCEGDYENMGSYKFVDGQLTATFEQDSYVFIKTEGNANWYMAEAFVNGDTAVLKNTNTGASEKMFVPGGVELTFTLTYGEGDTLTLSHVGGPCTHNYEQTVIKAATCTDGGEAKYVCSKCDDSYTEALEATGHDYRRGVCKNCGLEDETYVTPNYYLVGYINGVDYGSVDDYENRGEFRFEEGKLVINCTEDSYVFVKTEGNTAWYMTNEYCTDTSAVLYDTRDGAYEKMFIPAHMEVTFTLAEGENNSLTLSYVAVPCKHIFDDSVSVEADCWNDGLMLRTCRICTATAEKPIPAAGHDYKTVVTEPGCLTGGYTTYTCTRCGANRVDDKVEATGHDYDSKVTKEPGCETTGTMTYTCKNCGHSYSGTISAAGHNYVETVTKPTCTDRGFTTNTCAGCGDSYVTDNVPATGHNYKGVTNIPPSCVTDGRMTYTCTGCGDAYLQVMEKIGHNYVSEATKATCTDKGFTTHSCTICGDSYKDTYVNAAGHKFVNGKCSVCGEVNGVSYYLFGYINGANYGCEGDSANMGEYIFKSGKLVATFKADSYIGIKKQNNAAWYMCEKYTESASATLKNTSTGVSEKMFVPGGVELTFTLVVNDDDTLTLTYESVPCNHSYSVAITTMPACETPGVKTYTCSNCGNTYTENMDAAGHSYKAVVTKPTCTTQGITTYTCLVCQDSYTDKLVSATGHTMQSSVTKAPGCETTGITTYTCKNCTHSYTETIAATGHDYNSVVTKPGCVSVGFTTCICTGCGDTYKENEIPATGHDYTSVVTIEPTCTDAGTVSYLCANCGDTYAEELPATGHDFVEGKCSVCGKSEGCEHSWVDGVCDLCGVVCDHEYDCGICTKCSGVDPFYVPSYYLVGYINGANYGCEEDYENMGEYKFVNNRLVVTFEQDSYVFLKTEGNSAWYMTEEYTEDTTATFKNTSTGTSQKMLVPGGVEWGFILTVNEDDTLTLTYGVPTCDHSYEVMVSPEATCTEDGIATYTCTLCGESYTEVVPATGHSFEEGKCGVCGAADPDYVPTFYLVGWINGADYGCNGDYENMGQYKFVNGKLTATFQQDSYVFLKNADNTGWYMTKSFVDQDTATFYNTTTGASEKMFVPANVELTFTLTLGEDDTLTLTYGVPTCDHSYEVTAASPANCTKDGSITSTCILCGHSETETVPATGHKFVEGSCSLCGVADPAFAPDYYLVGYINGANHGCEEDSDNMGQYKFVDNQLVVTFTQDSYVFLKTTGNANWYMAQAFSNGTTAIFYNTTTGASEKLFVPAGVEITFTLTANSNDTLTLSYTTAQSVQPTLTLRSPTLEFKDMICIVAFYTAENTQDVLEMGMVTYAEKVDDVSVETAAYVIPGASYDASTGMYYSYSQGIHAKRLADTVYIAVYAKLADGTYAYSQLKPYSPITYANNQLRNSTDVKLKQLVVAMLNYGTEAQLFFNYNTDNLSNGSLTAEQKLLAEAYRSDMVSGVPTAPADKQGIFTNNLGFSARRPAVSFEGAFCINYFFTPKYAPVDGITLYYWNEADFDAASVLTVENATGSIQLEGTGVEPYRGDIEGIAAKRLSQSVYVAAVYSDGTNTWTSGVLGYSIGAYCSSQATGGDAAALAMATAVYGYHAKQFFG